MIVRSVNTLGDWEFGKGKSDYKRDIKAVSQNIKTRLQSFFGDCFFDLSAGIDWFNLLAPNQLNELKLAIAASILNTEGVTKIALSNISQGADRNILLQYAVVTEYGTVTDTFTFNSEGF